MEECLGVNGRQLFVRVDCNTVWKSDKTDVRAMSYYIMHVMANRVIFRNGLIQFSCILQVLCFCGD